MSISRSCRSSSRRRWISKANVWTISVRFSTRVCSFSMSSRFCCVSRARKRSWRTYSRSRRNTVDDGLDCLQVAVNPGGDLSSFGSFSHDVFLDRFDFGEVLVNQREIPRVLFARAVGGCGFRCHGFTVSVLGPDSTWLFHTGPLPSRRKGCLRGGFRRFQIAPALCHALEELATFSQAADANVFVLQHRVDDAETCWTEP